MLVEFIRSIKQKWQDYGMISLAIASFIFIVLLAVVRIGKKGTYDKDRNIRIYPERREGFIPVPPKKDKKDSTGETTCRQYLESRFNKKFEKARPDFLKNPVMGGYNLELDCYNPSLRLAIEYNGAQHYKFIPYFHRNKEAFANQKYRDEMKRVKCKEHGITLIEVPYTVSHEKIPQHLEETLLKFGF